MSDNDTEHIRRLLRSRPGYVIRAYQDAVAEYQKLDKARLPDLLFGDDTEQAQEVIGTLLIYYIQMERAPWAEGYAQYHQVPLEEARALEAQHRPLVLAFYTSSAGQAYKRWWRLQYVEEQQRLEAEREKRRHTA